jgi:alpha-L-fucosidase
VAENGNIEFNVGPTVDGRIDQPEWGLIQSIGNWLKVNAEAIYNAKGSPIGKLKYGRATHKPEKKTIYLHVFNWSDDGQFAVNGIKNKVTNAYLLADKSINLNVEQSGLQLKIGAPKQAPGLHVSVIVLEYEGELEVVEYFEFKKADKKGNFALDAESASIKGKGLRFEEGNNALGFWTSKDDYPLWGMEVKENGTFKVSVELACPQSNGGTFFLEIDGKQVGETFKVPVTGGWSSFEEVSLGSIKIKKGKHKVAVKSKELKGALMNLKALKLQLD